MSPHEQEVTLKAQVIREQGNHVEIRPGESLYAIVVNGIEYYFRPEDGEYDGWGRPIIGDDDVPPGFGRLATPFD